MTSSSIERANRAGLVAVVGMAGRFPGADSVDAFWNNLRSGVESIRFFSKAELLAAGVDPARSESPNFIPASGFLSGIEDFDARFFGMTPQEAQITDPQHRLFLEGAWAALEHAGYDPQRYSGLIGVYAGCGHTEHLREKVPPQLRELFDAVQFQFGSEKDFLSTRASYKLDLRGPSLTIQTACSTSLVAICMAWQALLTFQCDMALAGGSSIDLSGRYGYLHRDGIPFSSDGHCRAFSAQASGTVGGDAVGIVVLKRLEDAIAQGDRIYAVIKGAAINNDGSTKIGFAAPSVSGQSLAIAQALAVANVAPEQVSYIETHGTGTPLGDLIEVAALKEVFHTASIGSCAIGSVKSNVGHLNAAAGVAGFIKTVLALHHRELPPSLHGQPQNPALGLEQSPFYVNSTLAPWNAALRRAGVSAFGVGGTNAHVVLEEAPTGEPTSPALPWQLVTVSAKTPSALETATRNLSQALAADASVELADVAYTLHVGRRAFCHRRFAICQSAADASAALGADSGSRTFSQTAEFERDVVFLFPGAGSQYVNMGRGLYETQGVYRAEVDRCFALLQSEVGIDLRVVLFPAAGSEAAADERLKRPEFVLLALFVSEYALARLWQSWGVTPQALIGHSAGEYTAACLADVFSLEDALRLVAMRGRLFAGLPNGAMLSLSLTAEAVQPFLKWQLSLAAVNGPTSCVVSGPLESINTLEEVLRLHGIDYRKIPVAGSGHSAMVEPILDDFRRYVSALRLRPPQIPFASNLSGTWIRAEEAMSVDYWVRHLRETVRFGDGILTLLANPRRILLEVGPGQTLSTLAAQHPARLPEQVFLTSMRRRTAPVSDLAFLLESLGKLWLAGSPIDWEGFHRTERRKRVPLPTYPFERQRFWLDAPAQAIPPTAAIPEAPKTQPRDWYYQPIWRVAAAPTHPSRSRANWLILSEAKRADREALGQTIAQSLEADGHRVVRVEAGDRFTLRGDGVYTVRMRARADFEQLYTDLQKRDLWPDQLLHLWNLDFGNSQSSLDDLEQGLDRSFYSLIAMAQAIGSTSATPSIPMSLTVLTLGVQTISTEDRGQPIPATSLGLCLVLPKEYEFLSCRCIDISTFPADASPPRQLVRQILSECTAPSDSYLVAYRNGLRLIPTYESISLPAPSEATARLRQRGVYLITGGFGGMGLEIASYLAQTVQARLILVGRSAPPADWPPRRLAIEAFGSEVMVAAADISDVDAMQNLVAAAQQRFGHIDGVIHAAGIAGGGAIQTRDLMDSAAVLHPKVRGTLVLDKVLHGIDLDFFILCSSLNAILPYYAHADYAAANAFLDAFAQQKQHVSRTIYTSINWDAWRDVGMVNKVALVDARSNLRGMRADLSQALGRLDGVTAFQQILAGGRPQVLVSTVPLLPRIQACQGSSAAAEMTTPVAAKSSLPEAQSAPRNLFPRPALATVYAPPHTETEQALCEVWQEFLSLDRVGIHDNFDELGCDSLMAVRLVALVKARLRTHLSVHKLLETPTIAALAQSIEQQRDLQPLATARSSPLVTLRAAVPDQSLHPPLFLVHPVGGTVYIYRDLAQALGKEQPVYALEARGLDGREEPLHSIDEMAKSYIAAIRTIQPQGPYALGGASFGGVVAYEMAQRLEQQGERIGFVALIDSPVPGERKGHPDDLEILSYMMYIGGDSSVSVETLRQLSADEQWERYWSRSQVVEKLLPGAEPERLQQFLRVWKANSVAMFGYAPQPSKNSVLLFRALEKDPWNVTDPERGWQALAQSGLALYDVPGNHVTMNYAPQVQIIADRLREYLEALRTPRS